MKSRYSFFKTKPHGDQSKSFPTVQKYTEEKNSSSIADLKKSNWAVYKFRYLSLSASAGSDKYTAIKINNCVFL